MSLASFTLVWAGSAGRTGKHVELPVSHWTGEGAVIRYKLDRLGLVHIPTATWWFFTYLIFHFFLQKIWTAHPGREHPQTQRLSLGSWEYAWGRFVSPWLHQRGLALREEYGSITSYELPMTNYFLIKQILTIMQGIRHYYGIFEQSILIFFSLVCLPQPMFLFIISSKVSFLLSYHMSFCPPSILPQYSFLPHNHI